MEFTFEIGTVASGCRFEAHISEVCDTPEEAFARVQELRKVVEIPANDGSLFLSPRSPQERWNGVELSAIRDAQSSRIAILEYRRVFPQSTRTDRAIARKYEKLRYGLQQPGLEIGSGRELPPASGPGPGEAILVAGNEVLSAAEIPEERPDSLEEKCEECVPGDVCAAVQETVPEAPEKRVRKVRKDAWMPDEDEIVLRAVTADEAARQHEAAYPGKRSRAAIVARWTKYHPDSAKSAAGEEREGGPVQEPVDPVSPSGCPALPGRGTMVRFTEAAGQVLPGKTGKVIRRDEIQGEVLVDLGASDGSVWTPPQALEVM